MKMFSFYVSSSTVMCNSPPFGDLKNVLCSIWPTLIFFSKVFLPSFPEYQLGSFLFPTEVSLDEVLVFTFVLLSSHVKVRILQTFSSPVPIQSHLSLRQIAVLCWQIRMPTTLSSHRHDPIFAHLRSTSVCTSAWYRCHCVAPVCSSLGVFNLTWWHLYFSQVKNHSHPT